MSFAACSLSITSRLSRYHRAMSDPWSPKIAAFVVQALDLTVDPLSLVDEIVALKRDQASGISALELESSIGATPFLVYHYQIADGKREQLDADLATLEKAAELDTPGPRILAHAVAGDEAYVLATTPQVHRAMTGASAPGKSRSRAGKSTRVRTQNVNQLLDRLRSANRLAGEWLQAVEDAGGELSFTEQEAALALFLLDDRSIQDLLRALNVLISSARSQTPGSVG
jgi:hypothetical protein